MEQFVIGLCIGGLVACILYWEWRADRRWTNKFDVHIPKDQREYFDQVLDEYRSDQHRSRS